LLIQEDKTISEVAINEQIRDKEIRLIGEHGEQLGIMSAKEAYFKAQDAGLDLIKIAPTAKPPVCKIADYGKYKYEQLRREKEAKKRQKEIENFRRGLQPGVEVVTSGGIYGKIKEVNNGVVVLEIAHNVNIRVDISTVFATPAAMQEQQAK
jgi:preprotein translocase YajC subunit